MSTSKQVILVTGASSGIGLATAEALLERGHTVYGAARRVDRMAHLGARGGHALALDVTDDASMEAAVQTILDAEGRVDALVNNAGYGSYGAVEEVPIDEARRQFEVNLFGLARMIQLVLPSMRAQKSGTIVNVSSMGGKVYFPLGAWYHATKHALEGFSDSLRMELAEHGVDVVIVEPGAIRTEWSDIAQDHMDETSGSGPYADLTAKMTRLFEGSEGSPPTVIADVIVEAVEADSPKTRYVAGANARALLTARALLPDRAFDTLLRSQLK
ncbi:oxidoreductase [Rubrivirga marina]|uniref:Short-chain dehydrogenase/reductase n=1 Tax=Rubrivirga marina TaxID=1196024 RepID=A0A271IZL3_9BACT|nr:oxidoreductase [Rubrivirga marina]PAP76662.1 short-chain dehydrogenase/reductase [Rubrivirga marina]